MKILINDKEYEIDLNKSIELGVVKEVKPKLYFDSLEVGTLFLFKGDSMDVGIYVKTGPERADRIAGCGYLSTKVGDVQKGCCFFNNPEVEILKNGKWVSKKD